MSQHDDFLKGFGDAIALTDPLEIERHYQAWLESERMSEVERIDYETAGYETGEEYRKQLNHDTNDYSH